jgi:hypothetical protein
MSYGARMKFALSTFVVVLAVIVALPVSQLRLVTVIVECCCPDPAHCHCPDHHPTSTPHDTIQACHKSSDTFESASAPSFAPAIVVTEIVPTRALVAVHHAHATPHEPPSPERPSAPS